jgi:hypothetical protein
MKQWCCGGSWDGVILPLAYKNAVISRFSYSPTKPKKITCDPRKRFYKTRKEIRK